MKDSPMKEKKKTTLAGEFRQKEKKKNENLVRKWRKSEHERRKCVTCKVQELI